MKLGPKPILNEANETEPIKAHKIIRNVLAGVIRWG